MKKIVLPGLLPGSAAMEGQWIDAKVTFVAGVHAAPEFADRYFSK